MNILFANSEKKHFLYQNLKKIILDKNQKKFQFIKFYKIRKSVNPISVEKIRCGDKMFSCDT